MTKSAISLFLIILSGCQSLEEKSVFNCEKYIREKNKIDSEIKLIDEDFSRVEDSKLAVFPYENAVYHIVLEFDTKDEFKRFGYCLCDIDGEVIPEDLEFEKRMEREAENEIEGE